MGNIRGVNMVTLHESVEKLLAVQCCVTDIQTDGQTDEQHFYIPRRATGDNKDAEACSGVHVCKLLGDISLIFNTFLTPDIYHLQHVGLPDTMSY